MEKEQQQLAALVRGKKVAFIGAGVSHRALIEEFVGLGAQVTLCDKKPSVEAFGDYAATIRRLGLRLSLGEGYMDGFRGQDIILRTPGFEYYQQPLQDAIAAGAMVTSEVELFFDFCPCEIVAVTGSDGKTTTTTLISEMFKAAGRRVHLGGNIGAALLPMLPEVAPEDVAVVELSSFQLISMRKSPRVAVVTNVTPNHLDHHKDMQEYIDAKRNILLYQQPPCRAVLGYENDVTRAMQADCKGEQVWFTRLRETANGAFLRGDGMLCMAEGGKVTMALIYDPYAGELFYHIPGRHMPCYECALGSGGDLSARVQANHHVYSNQENLEAVKFEPGISADINFITCIGVKLSLDILNLTNPDYKPRLLDHLQQYTLVCNTSDPEIGGDMVGIFSYPLQVTTSLKVGFRPNQCSDCCRYEMENN